MTDYGIPVNGAGETTYAEQDVSKLTQKYNAKGAIVYGGVACIGGVDGTVSYRKFDNSSRKKLTLSEAEYQQLKQQDPAAVQGYVPNLGVTFLVLGDAPGNFLRGYMTARGYLSLTSVSGRQPGRSNIFNVVAMGRRPLVKPYDLMTQMWPRDPNDQNRVNLDIRTVVAWMLAGWDQTPIWEVTLSRGANGALYVDECTPVPDHVHAFYNQLLDQYRKLPPEQRFVEKDGAYGPRYQPNYKELERIVGKRLTVQKPQVTTQGPSGPSGTPGAPQAALQAPSQITPHAVPQNGQQVPSQVAPQIVPPASSQVTQPTTPQAPSQATSQFTPPAASSASPAASPAASSPASSQLIPTASPPASSPVPSQFTPPTQPQAPQQDASSAITPQSGEAPTIPSQFKL